MRTIARFVGLDVHKETIVIAVAEAGREAPRSLGTIAHDAEVLLRQLRRLGSIDSTVCCYEAGPTGYGLQRFLEAHGVRCQVIAPSLTPRRAGDRVKTDRRDAKSLAHFLRAGALTPIHVPDEASEAIRDLERAREDAKRAERTTRQQLAGFLLRHGRRYEGKTAWTKAHLEWIARQRFEHLAQQHVLTDSLESVERATRRVEELEARLAEVIESWSGLALTKALQALRGFQLLASASMVAEVGDFERFARAPQFMAFVGLVPSEHTSAESVRRGAITKTGNGRLRRLLVEAAWSYRLPPRRGPALARRSRGLSPRVIEIAWKAQKHLHARFTRLLARGKSPRKAVVAVARELAGFIWAIARESKRLAA